MKALIYYLCSSRSLHDDYFVIMLAPCKGHNLRNGCLREHSGFAGRATYGRAVSTKYLSVGGRVDNDNGFGGGKLKGTTRLTPSHAITTRPGGGDYFMNLESLRLQSHETQASTINQGIIERSPGCIESGSSTETKYGISTVRYLCLRELSRFRYIHGVQNHPLNTTNCNIM